jgi:Tfp pilus assembly protein PilO
MQRNGGDGEDTRVLEMFGAADDPQALRRYLGSENGLVYLNRTIDAARLTRVDFRTEPAGTDGPFTVEHFFITVEGSGIRLLDFVHAVESGRRLARFDQIRLDPVDETGGLAMRARVSIYSLADAAGGVQ